jgi:hypothetical protein
VDDAQPYLRGLRVLDRVRRRLGADVVRRDLDRLRQPRREPQVELDRDRRASGTRPERRLEPLAREERRVQAARELAEVVDRPFELAERAVREWSELRVTPDALREHPERNERCRQPLLGAVVQVALEAAPLLVGGPHDPEP